MASGNIVGIIGDIVQPAATYATFDTRAGGSTPAEAVPVYDFDDTTEEYVDVYCRLEGYAGGGLTISWDWSATSATTGDVRWGAAIRRVADDAEDIDSAQTYDFNEATDTTASASGERSRVTITFTDGADMDSLADGESFILRVRREPGDAADGMTGDAEAWLSWTLVIKET
jgi:hypothetical protein